MNKKIKSGVYKITGFGGKVYIGSAVNFSKRFYAHKYELRRGRHRNKHLQSAWNKYGEGVFKFDILELVEDIANLKCREQHWLDTFLRSVDRSEIYNICEEAFRPSSRFSDRDRLLKTHKFYSLAEQRTIVIYDLPKFCKSNNLNYTAMLCVSCGFRKRHKDFCNESLQDSKSTYKQGPRRDIEQMKVAAIEIIKTKPYISSRKLSHELSNMGWLLSQASTAKIIKRFKEEQANGETV